MKAVKIVTTIGCLIGVILVGVNTSEAVSLDSNGQVIFTAPNGITPPLSPLTPDPANPVVPVDNVTGAAPTSGTPGPLSLDFASSFNFGSQSISTTNQTYYATAQNYTEGASTVSGPNYVQVTDTRGTLAGWNLTVTQDAQFETSDTIPYVLTGAEVTLDNGNVTSNLALANPTLIPATVVSSETLVPGVTSEKLIEAQANQGAGTWIYRFGTDATTGANSVSLLVPGSTIQMAKSYATTLTWALNATP